MLLYLMDLQKIAERCFRDDLAKSSRSRCCQQCATRRSGSGPQAPGGKAQRALRTICEAIIIMPVKNYLLAAALGTIILAVAGCSGQRGPAAAHLPDQPPLAASSSKTDAGRKSAASPEAAYYFLAAQKELNAGNSDQAAELLKMAIAADPSAPELKVELAAIYLRRKQIDQALQLAEKAVEDDPSYLPALRLKAGLLYRQGKIEGAAALYEQALALGPRQHGVYIILGRLYLDRGRWDDAAGVFSKMVKVFPRDYTGYYYLGRAREGVGDLDEAEASYKKTLELDSSLQEPRWRLMDIYQRQGRFQEAVEICRQILGRDPLDYRASLALALNLHLMGNTSDGLKILSALGRSAEQSPQLLQPLVRHYIDKGKYQQALWLLKGMLRGNLESSSLHYVVAVTYDAMGKSLAALEHFKLVKAGSDFFDNAVVQIASLYQQLDRIDEGIAYLETVIASGAPKGDYFLYLAGFYEQKKMYRKALENIEKGLAIDDSNPRLYFRMGVVYDKMGRKQESIAAMRQVLELKPDDASALNYLGYTFADMGTNLREAEQLIRKALKLKPDDGYITDSLAWVFYKQGRYEDALKWMRKAVRLVPDDPVIMEHLGDVFLKLNQQGKALEAFLKSRKLRKGKSPKILEEKIRRLQDTPRETGPQ